MRALGMEEARCGQALATDSSYCFREGGDVPIVLLGAGGDLGCCDPWWLLALLHCLGTMSNSLLSPTGDGGHSFIVLVGLGGMLRLEQIWA